jgi:hypothetical protein
MNEKTGFGAPASLAAGSEITASGGTATGDFNNDGRPDIILADAGVFLSVTSYLTPTSLSFPSEMLGMPGSPQAITLTNSGPQAIELTGFTFSGLDPKDFSETNDCDGAIRAHSSCTVDVTFQPLADETRSAYLSFEEGPNATQIAALSGYATGEAPIVELSGYQLNWPSVPVGTPGATAQVKLTNIGNETLTSLAITITGTNPSDFAITGRSCGADVFSSGGCLITVQFTPSATGTRSATLTFTDNAYNSPQTVSLSGTGA